MVVGKVDPTVPNLFLSYLSNGEEYAKKDHGNEFRGSKNGEREVWVGLEWPENGEIRRPTVEAVVAFASPILARAVAVRCEISRPRFPCGGTPPWMARVSERWPETSPTAKTRLA